MSNSKLSANAIDKITQWMDMQAALGSLNLRQLIISNTKLIDTTGVRLIEGMHIANPDLRELDLSHNKISDRTWKFLNKFLESQFSIKTIDLKWNHISSDGVIELMDGIYKGRSCKNLNLSYNWLSRGQSMKMVNTMMKAINEWIVHLDLSNNNLSAPIWEEFGTLLKKNHTLYGIHMHGNNWYVDGHGFIKVGERFKDFQYSKNTVISPVRVTGHSKAVHFTSKNPFQFMSVTKWWVWEGWTESTFTIVPNKSMSFIEEPLHIHFDYNYYEPELMTLQSDGSYQCTTMCPPGRVMYFFTVNKIVINAKDHSRIPQKYSKLIKNIEHYDEVKNYKISKFHYRVFQQSKVLDENYFSVLKQCIPRPHLPKYVKPEAKEIRFPWLFETSVFAKYVQDNEELITKWFEFDWNLMQKPKFDKDEEQAVSEVLRKYYWIIKEIYKYQSAIATLASSSPFAIPLNSYTEYARNNSIINSKDISVSESDTVFLTINKRYKVTSLNPGTALIRFQWLEILMRLGLK